MKLIAALRSLSQTLMRSSQVHRNRRLILAACSLLVCTVGLQAANFHPIVAVGSNMNDGNPGGNPISNIIQGPGIGFDAAEPHNRAGGVWYTDAPGGFPSDYVAVHAGPEHLWFDLGLDVTLAEISYWGYSTGNANGVKGFNVSFATEAEGGATGLGDESYGTSITANPSFEAAIDTVPRQSFSFNPVTARYVRVEVTSTHFTNGGFGPPAGGDRVGVGEIAFEEVLISPDPQISIESEISLPLFAMVDVFDIPLGNAGNSELLITSVNLAGPNADAFRVPSFPSSLGPFLEDVIEVQFNPNGLVGPVSATLLISSNDPDDAVREVLLIGTVPPTERDIVVPEEVDLGRILSQDTFELTISNGGGSDLTIGAVSFTGPNAGAFSVVDPPGSIPMLSDIFLQIEIDPAGLDGLISATLQIESNDPDTPTAEIQIIAEALGDPDQFYPILSVQASSSTNDLWPASNLIQGPGVGFSEVQPHERTAGGPGGLWVTGAPGGFPSDYIVVAGTPILVFDLGENVPLCEISIWGYSSSNSNGLSEFSLRFASEADGPSGFGTSIDFNPSYGGIDSGALPNEDSISRFSFLFGQEVTARYVELTCLDNHFIAPGTGAGGEIPGGDRVGIGEVAFEITSCETPTFFFNVEDSGEDLILTWDSQEGFLYNIRSETEPTDGPPANWPIYDGFMEIAATPPRNMLIIPRPVDPLRLFVAESFPVPPVEVFADDFESGPGDWEVGSPGAAGTTWELGSPSQGGPSAANSPVNCFGTNLSGRYEIEADVWLRSPAIDLTTATEATLRYARFIDIEDVFDFGSVSILDAIDNSLIADIETGIDGLSIEWEDSRHSLPAAAMGKMIRIQFRLESDNFVDPTEYFGFYVDDVQVTAR